MNFFFDAFGDDDFSSFGKPTSKKDVNTTQYYEILVYTRTRKRIKKK